MKTGKPSSDSDKGRTDEKIATFCNISRDTLHKAEKIVEVAEQRMKSGKPCEESTQGKSRDIISNFAGVSHDTLRKC